MSFRYKEFSIGIQVLDTEEATSFVDPTLKYKCGAPCSKIVENFKRATEKP